MKKQQSKRKHLRDTTKRNEFQRDRKRSKKLSNRIASEINVSHIHTWMMFRYGLRHIIVVKLPTKKLSGDRLTHETAIKVLRQFQKEFPGYTVKYELGSYGGKIS